MPIVNIVRVIETITRPSHTDEDVAPIAALTARNVD